MGIGPYPRQSGPSGKNATMPAFFSDRSDEELLAIFEPMMDICLAGSNEIDHEKHVRDFTERLRAIVTRENLEAHAPTTSRGSAPSGGANSSVCSGASAPSPSSGGNSSRSRTTNSSTRRIS